MKIKEVRLQTDILTALAAFYRDVLGMKVGKTERQAILFLKDSTLVFEPAIKEQKPFYHFAFDIPYNKIDEAKIWLESRVQLMRIEEYNGYIAEFVNWEARSLYFTDPAGNIVEFIGRAGLKDNSDKPFNTELIRNVNELGIVLPAERYDDHVLQMMNKNQLTYFERQPALEHFRAVGDDEGLLICVPGGRTWYPTDDIAAGIFPISLSIETGGTIKEVNVG